MLSYQVFSVVLLFLELSCCHKSPFSSIFGHGHYGFSKHKFYKKGKGIGKHGPHYESGINSFLSDLSPISKYAPINISPKHKSHKKLHHLHHHIPHQYSYYPTLPHISTLSHPHKMHYATHDFHHQKPIHDVQYNHVTQSQYGIADTPIHHPEPHLQITGIHNNNVHMNHYADFHKPGYSPDVNIDPIIDHPKTNYQISAPIDHYHNHNLHHTDTIIDHPKSNVLISSPVDSYQHHSLHHSGAVGLNNPQLHPAPLGNMFTHDPYAHDFSWLEKPDAHVTSVGETSLLHKPNPQSEILPPVHQPGLHSGAIKDVHNPVFNPSNAVSLHDGVHKPLTHNTEVHSSLHSTPLHGGISHHHAQEHEIYNEIQHDIFPHSKPLSLDHVGHVGDTFSTPLSGISLLDAQYQKMISFPPYGYNLNPYFEGFPSFGFFDFNPTGESLPPAVNIKRQRSKRSSPYSSGFPEHHYAPSSYGHDPHYDEDIVEYGANTGPYGAFSWYADYPVHTHHSQGYH